MRSEEIVSLLGTSLSQLGEDFFSSLGTVARPSLEDDDHAHYDWVLIKKKGIELGFADAAYFDGRDDTAWGSQGLRLVQVTFYSDTRPGLSPYAGELPWGLSLADDRDRARVKLAAYEPSRRSYLTDCWDLGRYRLVVAYRENGRGLDSVHVKLPEPPLDESARREPVIRPDEWPGLFGLPATHPTLTAALAPLDVAERIDEGGDEREVDFVGECGISFYFEQARRLQTLRGPDSSKRLVLGAVKFYRARDLGARQFRGALPLGLQFSDGPKSLVLKLGVDPQKHSDGRLTGHALWHFKDFSLHALYSTVENQLFRLTLMAPGYWQDADDPD